MNKLFAIVGIGGLIATALAAGILQGASGRGVAVGQPGVTGAFGFEIRKAEQDGQVRLGGHFEITVREAATRRARTIRMSKPTEVVFGDNLQRAFFAGKGFMLSVNEQNQLRRLLGEVKVRVVDRRQPPTPGEPDLIRVTFVPDDPNAPTFTFDGQVRDGDIRIFQREIAP